ncbi:hypothetical protein [Marinobacter sp. ANT_B65]|uniref:hypothetical protein n=1 Tax=Marinobacter sp. ANT_B65 TaxID=2039467 RepID=UPI0015CCE4EE|nr:hypothetical protein [Marinobacter sp. ANT_B65]
MELNAALLIIDSLDRIYEGFELFVRGIGALDFHVDGVSVPISRYCFSQGT